MKITTKSTDKSISTGAVAQNDLKKYGYIGVDFYKNDKRIGVDVAGFSYGFIYYTIKPKTDKQKNMNDFFIERYINRCINPSEIKAQLGINQ